ncbi:UNVERIFIED_CONTAM: hypothetical protein Sradi_3426400 [Sesamum radiatum]|uniref:Uncharacterized protein n=1 Tax=Sesamum radiatum TaxID=300843 RepID=A0AAW2R4P6_SESRA
MFCGKIPWRLRWRKRPFTGVFCRWGLCLRWWWCCKKVDGTEDSFRGYCNEKSEKSGGGNDSESGCSNNKYENVGVGAAQESKRDCVEMESSSSPPKNALLLTRCRSAPYRSSSLGGRFWGSPLSQKDEPQNESEEVVQDNPSPIPNPSCCQNVVDEEARTISLQENSQELEMMKKKKKKNNNSGEEDLKGVNVAGGLTAVHPLLLTRCKSEPARTGERLIINPQPPNQTRFDNSSLHNS